MSGLTSEILIRLRPLLRAGSLSATGSSRYGQIHNPSHRWASSFSPWEGVHFFFSQRGVDFFKTGGGQGGGPLEKNSLEFLKSAIRAEKLLQK